MRKKLTKSALERKPPASGRIEIRDTDSPLALRISSDGRRSLAVRTRLHGRQIRFTYPRAATIENLTDARTWAHATVDACKQGIDPREDEKRKAEEKQRSARNTVEVVAAEWIKRDQAGNRSRVEVERILNRDVLPTWGKRTIQSIGRREVVELIDGIADRGALTMARRVHAHLHRMFRWCVARGIIDANPMADLPKTGKETARDRVLDDGELSEVWRAAGEIGFPFGASIRLLILTGGRRAEIGSLTWDEIDGDVIRLAGERTKTGDPRTIPLAPEAQAILESLPRFHPVKGALSYVFTTNGKTSASGWGKAKTRLDTAILEARRKAFREAGEDPERAEPLAPWRLHDLRRTAATGLQRLGHRLEVIEAVLGHVSGSRAGIVGVYQRHSWDQEKRIALEAWARHVAAEGQEGAEIVSIEQAREQV